MSRKRKYKEVKGYWVYSITIPSVDKFYIGVSKRQCCDRWQKSQYKSTILNQYLEEWDSMEKTVLVDNLSKEQAYQYEDNIIRALSMNDLCINKRRSGLIEVSDANAYNEQWRLDNPDYMKQWQKDNKEKWNEYQREWRKDNKEKWNEYQREWRKNNREKWNEYQREKQRQRRLKKKLEKQNQQLNLFS